MGIATSAINAAVTADGFNQERVATILLPPRLFCCDGAVDGVRLQQRGGALPQPRLQQQARGLAEVGLCFFFLLLPPRAGGRGRCSASNSNL